MSAPTMNSELVADRRPALEWASQRWSGASVTTICHPVFQLGRGGLERQLLQVIDRLPADAFRHVLVVRGRDEHSMEVDVSSRENVSVIDEPSRGRDCLWWRRLGKILKEHSVDVLHVRGLSMLLDAVLAGRFVAQTPVAFSFHGMEGMDRPFGALRRSIYRTAIRHCNARWAVSGSAAESIAAKLGIDPRTFDVLPNGVDTERFCPTSARFTIRRRLGIPLDRLIVLSVGNLKPIKGHRVLLDALGGLRSLSRDITTVFVGGDYLDGDLYRRAAAQLPDFDVRFAGAQADVLPWLQSADVFVQPSLYEGLSNALLEAMSCGLPVVATRVGGNREIIDHGRNGLLAAPGDAMGLASALQYALEDADCRVSLGSAARRFIQQHYTAGATAAQYGERYAELHGRATIGTLLPAGLS